MALSHSELHDVYFIEAIGYEVMFLKKYKPHPYHE